METIVHTLVDKNGNAVQLVAPEDIEWPTVYLEEFDSCCGPGSGIGDLCVPDTIWTLKVSAACFVHDWMWRECDATWSDFHHANSVFFHNILAIIDAHGGLLRYLRCYRAVTYYTAVDTIFKIFWSMKTTDT